MIFQMSNFNKNHKACRRNRKMWRHTQEKMAKDNLSLREPFDLMDKDF